jgi:multiple sugar transport system permease protein
MRERPVTTPVVPSTEPRRPRGRARNRRSRRDTLVLAAMLTIPVLVHLALVWGPALGSVALSFASWDGIGGLADIEWVGVENYQQIFELYPPFWTALRNNVLWLVFFVMVPTPLGLFLAVLLDKGIRFSRFYQGAIYLPVVLSLAVVGLIWQNLYSTDNGLINNLLDTTMGSAAPDHIDWFGDRDINIWAALVAASWRHTGYIMVLYLAGLKAVDPTLREAAALDGAGEAAIFRHVTFPSLRPVNVVVLVVTVVESLRAFDIVWVINKGTNGLELLSTLVAENIIGEAQRIGYGSALAVMLLVISTGFVSGYLIRTFRESRR